MVRASASTLWPVVAHYVYLSTVSAYRSWPDEPLTDDSAVFNTDGMTGTVDASHGSSPAYGPLKAACERAAQDQLGADSCLILRPGVVLDPAAVGKQAEAVRCVGGASGPVPEGPP
jgi:2'-hydroxyisoflavone reductase